MSDKLFIETKYRVNHSAITLWRKTALLATKEYKIPVVCLAEKHRHGFWVLCHSDDLQAIANVRNQAANLGNVIEDDDGR